MKWYLMHWRESIDHWGNPKVLELLELLEVWVHIWPNLIVVSTFLDCGLDFMQDTLQEIFKFVWTQTAKRELTILTNLRAIFQLIFASHRRAMHRFMVFSVTCLTVSLTYPILRPILSSTTGLQLDLTNLMTIGICVITDILALVCSIIWWGLRVRYTMINKLTISVNTWHLALVC